MVFFFFPFEELKHGASQRKPPGHFSAPSDFVTNHTSLVMALPANTCVLREGQLARNNSGVNSPYVFSICEYSATKHWLPESI